MTLYLTVECDRCGEAQSENPSIRYAKRVWREQGWSLGKEDICPDCRDGSPAEIRY